MTQELMVRQTEVGIMIPPEETLELAARAATALKQVVSKKLKPVIMNGEQYLEYEDLQLLGQFYGYTVRTGDAVPVEVDGVKGAKAHADLIDSHTGQVLGGAEAYCMRDEEKWNTRPKYEWQDQGEGKPNKRVQIGVEIVPWFQLASMAQTRAGAKAFRNRLAWVVVLAGYRPTPAEEMSEGTVSDVAKERRTVDKSEHYCHAHGTNFFMKGKMKSYAHPIGDTGEWCHEHKENKPPDNVDTQTGEIFKGEEAPVKSKQDPAILLDMKNLKTAMETLGWTREYVCELLKTRYQVTGEKVTDCLKLMDSAMQSDFWLYVQEQLKAKAETVHQPAPQAG